MIRSILTLNPRPGQARALLGYIREQGILARAQAVPGCLRVEVGLGLPDGEAVVVTGLWASIESYERWLQSPDRLQGGAGMMPLLATTGEAVAAAGLYRIIETGVPAAGARTTFTPAGSAGP